MAENHGSWLSTAMAIFLPWSTLTFVVRAWTKLRTKTWGLDDYSISAAVAVGVANVAVTCTAIQKGYGRPIADIPQPDLARAKKSVSGILRSAHDILWAAKGNIDRPWDELDDIKAMYSRWIGIEVTGLIIELGLWLLSIHLVWGLQMQFRKRIFILCAFAARLGLIPIIACRLNYLHPLQNPDPMLNTIISGILAQGAIHYSIIAGSITCLKPFLRTFNPACAIESRTQDTTSRNATRDSYYKLETLKRTEHSLMDSDDSANWRPYQGSAQGHVVAYPSKPHLRTKDKAVPGLQLATRNTLTDSRGGRRGAASVDVEGTDRLVIQRTTEVSIRYERNPNAGYSI
ncbi:hypothetical protein QQS21_011924 [Conoideocrella luteorostrata]|uniref:Integral membrane protein n=1 Tax=Conoideocrella luteorostrata TaxID=1105319 RepID=A0AAJ0CD79_9HYPO|nr:hypothetical protein QQS21_011924 [Conoideocrella luteorostrata]